MVVGVLKIEFRLRDNHSLKEKRKIVKSMVDKVKHRFNVSVAEVGANDKWQKVELGISVVSNDTRHTDTSMSSVVDFLEAMYVAEIVSVESEIIHV